MAGIFIVKICHWRLWYNMVTVKNVEKAAKPISADVFECSINQAAGLVIVEFYSENCRFCSLMRLELEELAKEYEGSLTLMRIDVSENNEIAMSHSVVSTPTIIMFAGGKPVARVLGYITRHDLKGKIDEQLKLIA